MRTRIAAVLVVIALAGVAYYAMFSGPTVVPVSARESLANPAPAEVAPAGEEQSPERGEGGGGG
ncbi:MAG TPA: hypothetical protein VIJ21_09235 [Solirubrobacterales bacterium]